MVWVKKAQEILVALLAVPSSIVRRAAGEAIGSVLVRLLREIADNAEVRARLTEEVDAFHELRRRGASGDKSVQHTNLDELPYLDAFLREGLRKFAPATLVQRVCLRATEVGGVRFERGVVVGICPTAIHMNESLFPRPWEFDPERFGRIVSLADRLRRNGERAVGRGGGAAGGGSLTEKSLDRVRDTGNSGIGW